MLAEAASGIDRAHPEMMTCGAAGPEAAKNMRWMQGMLAQILTCIGASAAVFLTYTLLVVVQTEPWYSPQYFIPILGETHPPRLFHGHTFSLFLASRLA